MSLFSQHDFMDDGRSRLDFSQPGERRGLTSLTVARHTFDPLDLHQHDPRPGYHVTLADRTVGVELNIFIPGEADTSSHIVYRERTADGRDYQDPVIIMPSAQQEELRRQHKSGAFGMDVDRHVEKLFGAKIRTFEPKEMDAVNALFAQISLAHTQYRENRSDKLSPFPGKSHAERMTDLLGQLHDMTNAARPQPLAALVADNLHDIVTGPNVVPNLAAPVWAMKNI